MRNFPVSVVGPSPPLFFVAFIVVYLCGMRLTLVVCGLDNSCYDLSLMYLYVLFSSNHIYVIRQAVQI